MKHQFKEKYSDNSVCITFDVIYLGAKCLHAFQCILIKYSHIRNLETSLCSIRFGNTGSNSFEKTSTTQYYDCISASVAVK